MRIIPYIALAICAIAIVGTIGQTYAADHLPASQNVQVTDSDRPGHVIVSWEPVPDARYYRIGWTSLTAVELARTDGRNWMNTFTRVDIDNLGDTAHTVPNLDGKTLYAFIVGTATERYGKAVWSEWAYHTTPPRWPFVPHGGCRSDPPPPPQTTPTPEPPTPTPTPTPAPPTEQPVATLRNGSQHRHTTP